MRHFKDFLKTVSLSNFYYLWMILIFTCATAFFDIKTALIELLIFLVLLLLFLWSKYHKKARVFKYINSLNLKLANTDFKTLHDFSIPVVILRTDGYIEWNNKAFSELCQKELLYNIQLSDYIAEFDINKYKEKDEDPAQISYKIHYNGHSYRVMTDFIYPDSPKDIDDYYIVLYWYDYTKYESLKVKYHNEAFVSCILVVDNYDEVMQSTPSADKPQLTAYIEEALNSLAQDANGILKKYEKDRFFLYIQKEYLEKMIRDSFSFTESFKTILTGNTVAPTLSIGIGTEGETLIQNDAFAYSALDMALSRGGDQVVIKDNDKYHFYGGKTREVEKRTRVKARVVSQALKEIIQSADQIMIMGHRYADVDVLGSAVGLYSIIRSLGKDAKIIMETYNQTVERALGKYGDAFTDIIINKAYANEYITPDTLLFVVDTQKTSMVEEPALIDVSKNIVIIDHHQKSADFIQDALITYHEPYASSTCELVTEMLQYIDEVQLTKNEAIILYSGIFMDTKNFTFKTGVRTFDAASYLKRCGADPIEVKKLFQIDLNTFVKKWAIIENASTYRDKVAIAVCAKNDDDMQTIVAQAADELLNITNISSSFVICDMDGTVIVSARSFGEINVQVITEKLGGGGHMTIAGVQFNDKTIEEVEQLLKNAINDYLDK